MRVGWLYDMRNWALGSTAEDHVQERLFRRKWSNLALERSVLLGTMPRYTPTPPLGMSLCIPSRYGSLQCRVMEVAWIAGFTLMIH